jgi:hypothetical protein
MQQGSLEDRENFSWVKNSKIDFSLARNTIVVWTIQSAFLLVGKHLWTMQSHHWAKCLLVGKHLCSQHA